MNLNPDTGQLWRAIGALEQRVKSLEESQAEPEPRRAAPRRKRKPEFAGNVIPFPGKPRGGRDSPDAD